MANERRLIAVAVRVRPGEYRRWERAAALEDLRIVELVREAVRAHVRELERLRLLGAERGARIPLTTAGFEPPESAA